MGVVDVPQSRPLLFKATDTTWKNISLKQQFLPLDHFWFPAPHLLSLLIAKGHWYPEGRLHGLVVQVGVRQAWLWAKPFPLLLSQCPWV